MLAVKKSTSFSFLPIFPVLPVVFVVAQRSKEYYLRSVFQLKEQPLFPKEHFQVVLASLAFPDDDDMSPGWARRFIINNLQSVIMLEPSQRIDYQPDIKISRDNVTAKRSGYVHNINVKRPRLFQL